MAAYLTGKIDPREAIAADEFLVSIPEYKTLEECDFAFSVICEKDVEWAKANGQDEEYWRDRIGQMELNVSQLANEEDAEELFEAATVLFEKLNKQYRVVYGGDALTIGEHYFTMQQMQRITEHGKLLSPSGDDWRDRRIHRRLLRRLQGVVFKQLDSEVFEAKGVGAEVTEAPKSFYAENDNFYPTPPELATRLLDEIDYTRPIKNVLEPSAGKGDLIEAAKAYTLDGSRWSRSALEDATFKAIESDPTLQAVLKGKGVTLLDSDFLAYSGGDIFDLIIMNPPFANAEAHLHKALDIMFSGQIAAIMPAEVLLHPFSNERQRLVSRLKELDADFDFVEGAFSGAERGTDVDIAIVYVDIRRNVESDLFTEEMESAQSGPDYTLDEEYELAGFNKVFNLVLEYNREREQVTEQILSFYRNHRRVGGWLRLSVAGDDSERLSDDKRTLTEVMRDKINSLNEAIRKSYWHKALELDEIKRRLTSKKAKEIEADLEYAANTEFTESNVRQFLLNLIEKYPTMISEAIEYMFDKLTSHALNDRWNRSEYLSNIHYYSGWKTNSAYRVNKKVIIPFYAYDDIFKRMRLSWDQEMLLNDFDRIMCYFTGGETRLTTAQKVVGALESGVNRNIDTEFFVVSVYKKGTLHLSFKDEELLRRFNIEACKHKNFLPDDYAQRPYSELNEEEKAMADVFEVKGEKSYETVTPLSGLMDLRAHFQLEAPKPAPEVPNEDEAPGQPDEEQLEAYAAGTLF